MAQAMSETAGAARSGSGGELRREILVWGSFMRKLRHKIESDPARPRYIVTEPGVGYRLRGVT